MKTVLYLIFIGLFLYFIPCISSFGQADDAQQTASSLDSNRKYVQNQEPIQARLGRYFSDGKKLNTQDIFCILSYSPDSTGFNMYKTGRKQQYTGVKFVAIGGSIMAVGSIVLIGVAINELDNGGDGNYVPGYFLYAIGGGMLVSGFVKMISGKRTKNKAISIYNNALRARKSNVGFYFKPSVFHASVGLRF